MVAYVKLIGGAKHNATVTGSNAVVTYCFDAIGRIIYFVWSAYVRNL